MSSPQTEIRSSSIQLMSVLLSYAVALGGRLEPGSLKEKQRGVCCTVVFPDTEAQSEFERIKHMYMVQLGTA